MTRIHLRHFARLFPVVVVLCAFSMAAGLRAEESKKEDQVAPAHKAEGGARIEFQELAFDFGKVKQNEVLKHTFTFKNVGKGVLIIEKVKAG